MTPSPFLLGLVLATTLVLGPSLTAVSSAIQPAADAPPMVRGLWVSRAAMSSPATIARLVDDAAANGFETLIVQVRARGDAYYRSQFEPRAASLGTQRADFDPLGTTIGLARAKGLKVHAWIAVNLVASAVDAPMAPSHVVTRHPEWLMLPRSLGQELHGADPLTPGYLGRLTRVLRTRTSDVEGLYASPIPPDAALHVVAVALDIVRAYDIDGLHLDYIRFPAPDFDYSRGALAAFRDDTWRFVEANERARLDRVARDDVFAWVDMFPARWAAFRRARLTSLVQRLRTAVRQEKPRLVFSAAVRPNAEEAATERFQDWRLWLDEGLIDVAVPMMYTTDAAQFGTDLATTLRFAAPSQIWTGIGAWRIDPEQSARHAAMARDAGAAGAILFSYDSLEARGTSPSEYLARVARATADLPPSHVQR
jgi:uncharacterized lipoprotein YddW (UPF0748 family)